MEYLVHDRIGIGMEIEMDWNRNRNSLIPQSVWFVSEIEIKMDNFYCCYLVHIKMEIEVNSNFYFYL